MRPLTRRRLMAQALGVAVASQMPLTDALAAHPPVASERAWRELGQRLRGPLLRPGAERYAAVARPFNRRYAGTVPAGIARCASERDVRTAIRWAREHDVPVAARSGGHSYAGYSTTRGLLIDLGGLRAISVDDAGGTVSAQPGARNTTLYAGLQPHEVAISAGRCPTVGVGGLTLGGGFGFSSRAMGLTCDALVSTRMVKADGTVVRASATENPDLFWALRGGGGGNFGINTAFTYATTPVGDVGLYDLEWDAEHARPVLAALAEMVIGAPDRFSCRMGMGGDGHSAPTVTALGQHFDGVYALRELLGPVLATAKPRKQLIAQRTFWQAKDHFFHNTPIDRFGVKSSFVRGPLTPEAIDVIVRGVERYPGSHNRDGGGVALYAWGGAINRVPADATAFVHRDATWLMAYDCSWTARDTRSTIARSVDWLDGLDDDLHPHVSGQAYQNFMDRSQRDWKRAYYGDASPRLAAVKAEIDPDDVFAFRQGV